MAILYFAYGSNLDPEVRRERGLPAKPMSSGWLRGHRLAFDKASQNWGAAANVVPCPSRDVWGLLFEVTSDQWRTLVSAERGYADAEMKIEADDSATAARSFVARRDRHTVEAPATEYVERILRGLHHHEAPMHYIERVLRAALKVFPNREDGEKYFPVALAELDAMVIGLGLEVPGPDCDAMAFERLCRSAVNQQRGAFGSTIGGSWALIGDDDVDRDIRQDLIVWPTAVALALLVTYRRLAESGLPSIPGLDDRIRDGMRFLAATHFSGHGYDRLHGALKILQTLAKGGVPTFLARNGDFSPALVAHLRSLRQELAEARPHSEQGGGWGIPARDALDAGLAALLPLSDA